MTKTNYISASVALLAALLAASFLVLALPKVASSQVVVTEKEIDCSGKLSNIWVNNQLGCQVDHSGNGEGGEFFGGELSSIIDADDYVSCATWIAVGSETFGIYYEELTPRSQSMGGKGTKRKPFKITTVSDVGNADVGNTGLRVTQVDSYRVTDDYYRTKVTLQNRKNSKVEAIVYRAGDCYLNMRDTFTRGKLVGSNQPACESTDQAKPEELSLIPISSGSSYFAGDQNLIWPSGTAPQPYENTIINDKDPVSGNDIDTDSGVGLSWEVSIGAGNQVSRSNYTKVTIPIPDI